DVRPRRRWETDDGDLRVGVVGGQRLWRHEEAELPSHHGEAGEAAAPERRLDDRIVDWRRRIGWEAGARHGPSRGNVDRRDREHRDESRPRALAASELPEKDRRDEHDAVLLAEERDDRRDAERYRPPDAGDATSRPRANVADEPAQDAEGRQLIRPTDDVRHRLRRDRMEPEDGRGDQRGRLARDQRPDEEVHRRNASEMQQQVHDVIAEGTVGVPEDGMVEEVRERREWTIEGGGRERLAVVAREGEPDVPKACFPQGRVLEDQRPRVEHEL